MKILKLAINDLKRITAMEIDAEGKPVALSGDNGAGKSSVIDAIVWALTGKALADPIRHGAIKGGATITLGDDPNKPLLVVERSATRKADYLKVTNPEGTPISSPQKFLDTLIQGRLALDPMEFLRMKPRDQAVALREALGLVDKTKEIDNRRKLVFDERTAVNRERERARAKLQPYDAELAEQEPRNVEEVVAELETLRNDKAALESRIRERSKHEAELLEINDQIAVLLSRQGVLGKTIEATNELIDAMPAVSDQDIDIVRRKVADNDQRNTAIRYAKDMAAIEREALAYEVVAGKLTEKIEACDQDKADLLASVKMPYPGMEITDDGVYIKGELLEQQSTGEQIKISCLIAMAARPDLRLLIIRQGALINEKNLAMVYSIANSRDWQIWIEHFSETPRDGALHIVAGKIEQPEE